MKYIDLNQDIARQIVVDREKGCFLGQVSTVLLKDGKTIVAVYPKGHGRGSIVEKISRDGGKTWSDRMALPESFVTSMEVPTIFRLQDTQGKERLMLFSGYYPIRRAVSEDGGITWSDLEQLSDFGGICAMGDVVALGESGRYMALFHDDGNALYGGDFSEKHTFRRFTDHSRHKYMRLVSKRQSDGAFGEAEQHIFVDGDRSVAECNGQDIYEVCFGHVDQGVNFHINKLFTEDGGLTWSEPQTIARHAKAHLCEPGAIRLQNGDIAVLMRENSRKFNSFIMFSQDNGQTFTKPVELPDCLTGDRHVCRRLKDGRIAVTFRDYHPNSDTRGDWMLWIGTDEDLYGGREGEYVFRLKDNLPNDFGWDADCAYAGFHVLEDGTLVLISYGHWEAGEPAFILAIHLHPDEFDAV